MKKIVKISAILLVLTLAVGMLSACSLVPQSKQLLGKWVDSSQLNSGYEFLEGGKAKITFADVNIPILNQKFNGTIDGIYTTAKEDDKNILTLTYTVLLQSIERTYEYSVKDDVLTLIDTENSNKVLFTRGEVPQSDTAA